MSDCTSADALGLGSRGVLIEIQTFFSIELGLRFLKAESIPFQTLEFESGCRPYRHTLLCQTLIKMVSSSRDLRASKCWTSEKRTKFNGSWCGWKVPDAKYRCCRSEIGSRIETSMDGRVRLIAIPLQGNN